jgi:hypothetical protein
VRCIFAEMGRSAQGRAMNSKEVAKAFAVIGLVELSRLKAGYPGICRRRSIRFLD